MENCTSCGAPLKEGAAFCSQCGAAAGAQAPAVAPDAPAPAAAAVATAPKKSARGLLLSLGSLVVVAAIVVGLLFVFGVFKSDDEEGGSSSPEAAVAHLVNSSMKLDIGSALNGVAPGELDGFSSIVAASKSDGVKAAADRLKSLVAPDGADSGGMNLGALLPGEAGQAYEALSGLTTDDLRGALRAISVSVDNLAYETTNLADGIASVTITSADLTVAADSSKIPADVKSKLNALISSSDDVPSSVSDLLNGDTKVSHTWKLANYLDDIAAAGQKVDVIVVERDGQWYTSVIGTIAQHVYEAAVHELEGSGRSLAQPDWNLYANPPAAITASSPEAVATNLADALNAHSIQQLLQNLPQDEVRVLYPFVGLLQEAAESGGVDESTGQFTGMHAITVGTEGNLVHVIYDKGTITINDSGEQNVASVDNGCYAADGDQTCFAQWPPFAQTLAKVFGVDKGIPLTLRNVDGGYQLDPIASVTGLVASAVAHVDQVMDALDQFIDFVGQQFAQYGQGFAS